MIFPWLGGSPVSSSFLLFNGTARGRFLHFCDFNKPSFGRPWLLLIVFLFHFLCTDVVSFLLTPLCPPTISSLTIFLTLLGGGQDSSFAPLFSSCSGSQRQRVPLHCILSLNLFYYFIDFIHIDLTVVAWQSLQLLDGEFHVYFVQSNVSFVILWGQCFELFCILGYRRFLPSLTVVERRELKFLAVIQDFCICHWIFKFPPPVSKFLRLGTKLYVY